MCRWTTRGERSGPTRPDTRDTRSPPDLQPRSPTLSNQPSPTLTVTPEGRSVFVPGRQRSSMRRWGPNGCGRGHAHAFTCRVEALGGRKPLTDEFRDRGRRFNVLLVLPGCWPGGWQPATCRSLPPSPARGAGRVAHHEAPAPISGHHRGLHHARRGRVVDVVHPTGAARRKARGDDGVGSRST